MAWLKRMLIGLGMIVLGCFISFAQDVNLMRDWYIKNTRDTGKSLEVRVAFCDSLLSLPSSKGEMSEEGRVDVLILKAHLQQSMMHYRESEQSYLEAIKSLPKGEEKYLDVLLHIGVVKRARGDSEGAIGYLGQVLSTPKPDSLKYIDASAYSFLALLAMKHTRYDLAEKFLTRGDSLMEIVGRTEISERKRQTGISDISCSKGLFYFETGDFVNARKCLNTALEISGDARASNIVLVNLGLVYLEQGHEDVAEEYFKEAINKLDSKLGILLSVVDLLHIYIGQGRFDEARQLINDYGEDIEEVSHNVTLHTYYINRAIVEEHYHNYAAALKYRNLNDSLESSGVPPVRLREVHTLLNKIAATGDNPNAATHPGVAPHKWIFLFLLVLFLCLVVLSTWHIKYRKRLLNKIIEASHRLSASQNEVEKLQTICNELTKRCENAADSDALDEGAIEDKDSFSHKLTLLHPDLTKNEIELSGYLLKNLSAKEIAAMTHRSVRTIESVKYTLRKKLAVDEPTTKYLHRIDTMSLSEIRRQHLHPAQIH